MSDLSSNLGFVPVSNLVHQHFQEDDAIGLSLDTYILTPETALIVIIIKDKNGGQGKGYPNQD